MSNCPFHTPVCRLAPSRFAVDGCKKVHFPYRFQPYEHPGHSLQQRTKRSPELTVLRWGGTFARWDDGATICVAGRWESGMLASVRLKCLIDCCVCLFCSYPAASSSCTFSKREREKKSIITLGFLSWEAVEDWLVGFLTARTK